MKASFPYEKEDSEIFGPIYRPLAEVEVWSRLINDWVKIPMIVDTGADYTLFPKYMAQDLGISLKKDCTRHATFGVGGQETVYIYKRKASIKLGQWQGEIPVGFLKNDEVPPLIGRLKCLDCFDLLFSSRRTYFLTRGELSHYLRK